jgi:hypothetical protein
MPTSPQEIEAWAKLGGWAVAFVLVKLLGQVVMKMLPSNGSSTGRRLGDISPDERDARIADIVKSAQLETIAPILERIAVASEQQAELLVKADDAHHKTLLGIGILLDRTGKNGNGKALNQ